MLVEFKSKSQVMIPKDVVKSLGLRQGDYLDIQAKDGCIVLTPVVSYSQDLVDELRASVKEVKEKISKGEQPIVDTVDSLLEALENYEM